MRASDAAVMARLDSLITKGEQALTTARLATGSIPPLEYVDGELYNAWRAQSLHALRSLLGEESTYSQAFADQAESHPRGSYLRAGLGILRSVREDAANGHLFATMAGLISAEIFTDFLDMAQHLLDAGYIPVAASLTGAVLEDGLRRIAQNNLVPVKDRDDISALNQKLVQAPVYNMIVRKEVEFWNGIRNSADHGKFGDFNEEQVRKMHRGVSAFLAQYLK